MRAPVGLERFWAVSILSIIKSRGNAPIRTSATVPAHYSTSEPSQPSKRHRKAVAAATITDESERESASSVTKKPARKKRKKTLIQTKAEDESSREDEGDSFPTRVSSPFKIGAHVSAAGGIENAVRNAAMVGANAFALFVKSQRKWESAPLSAQSIATFKRRMQQFGYSSKHVLPHGSYLINLGNPDEAKRQKSFDCFLDDLQRCEQLGLELYNFHPGSTVGQATKEESIALIADCINDAHDATKSITIVIENMAGSGNIIGSQFSELKAIIDRVQDKTRVGVCLDTCHMFAAGYDISTKYGWDATLSEFDSKIGSSYLKALHLNDSKTALGSKKDRHENIGLGNLGIRTFKHIFSDSRIHHIPLILETPMFEDAEIWKREISVLYRLSALALPSPHSIESESGSKSDDAETRVLEALANEITSLVHSRASNKAVKTKTRVRKKKRDVKKGEEDEEHEHEHACDSE